MFCRTRLAARQTDAETTDRYHGGQIESEVNDHSDLELQNVCF